MRIILGMVVGLVALVGFAAVGVVLLVFTAGSSVEVDEPALALSRERLHPVVVDLNAVKDPPYTTARKARFVGCSMDSGDVFQPQVHRVWRLTGPARVRSLSKVTVQAREAAADIAEQLLARGWKGSSRLTGELPFTGLRRPHGHYTLGVSIQAFNDVVLATAKTTAPRRVCTKS